VEWGEGKVEELSEARLQVVIGRTVGGTPADPAHGTPAAGARGDGFPGAGDGDDGEDAGGDDVRDVTITGIGPRWAQEDFSALTGALVDDRS
jgi:tRNA threonylcarbamoyladenosine biosynthesis protein TsaE